VRVVLALALIAALLASFGAYWLRVGVADHAPYSTSDR